MIITQKKPKEELLAMLEGVTKVALVGCRLPDRRGEGAGRDEGLPGGEREGGGGLRPA